MELGKASKEQSGGASFGKGVAGRYGTHLKDLIVKEM